MSRDLDLDNLIDLSSEGHPLSPKEIYEGVSSGKIPRSDFSSGVQQEVFKDMYERRAMVSLSPASLAEYHKYVRKRMEEESDNNMHKCLLGRKV